MSFKKRLRVAKRRSLSKAGKILEEKTRQSLSRSHRSRTGRLARSVRTEVDKDSVSLSLAPHARILAQGRRPGALSPSKRRALAFKGRSGLAFSKGHRIRGFAGSDFIRRALDRATPEVKKFAGRESKRALVRHVRDVIR